MQSTGHSSMHARSSTSTQGWAMMYVTYKLLCQPGLGAGQAVPDSVLRMRAASRSRPRCIAVQATSRHRRLSAKRDPPASRGLASRAWQGDPALTAVVGSPLVALVGHAPQVEAVRMAD